ncbi:MAG: tRNA pseudouridine(55) synthase TruB, partial [Clostridia bacterium]|nr:tRNA pseudouridine(55) synthase TruB [Clostridia bacterium]
ILQEKKVGHAGTLDPMATGVLPVLLGKATRALDFLPTHDKRYTATLRFGFKSDTLDVWGKVTATGGTIPTREAVEAVLPAFRGNIMQIPPMTSALKKDGRRLYELAREGIEVERAPRPITVYSLDILQYDAVKGELTFDCHCSKGTYIRSICDDIGRALGCGGIMTALRRTQAAGFSLADSIPLSDETPQEQLLAHILPTESLFTPYPAVLVSEKQAIRFANGGALALDRLKAPVTNDIVRVKAPNGTFLGLGKPDDQNLNVLKLF